MTARTVTVTLTIDRSDACGHGDDCARCCFDIEAECEVESDPGSDSGFPEDGREPWETCDILSVVRGDDGGAVPVDGLSAKECEEIEAAAYEEAESDDS